MNSDVREKIAKLRDSGLSWKAKEILQGTIGQAEYNSSLYKLYGEVLLDLGDRCEAGKYLFLGGGSQEKNTSEAISIFLNRHNKKDVYGFFALMPKKFVSSPYESYPKNVIDYIENKKFKKKDIDRMQSKYHNETGSLSFIEKAMFSSIAILVIILIVIGLGVIISTIYEWAFS